MYKVIMADNYLDSKNVAIHEKSCETFEAAEESYALLFEQAKKLIIEVLGLMMEMDKAHAPVIEQIISVVNEIGLNEEIELKNREEKFLVVEKNSIEFSLAGKHIVAKIV